MTIHTTRLQLVPATAELAALEIDDPTAFGSALAAGVPADWPPEQLADALPFFLGQLTANPNLSGWLTYYGLLTRDAGQLPILVASGGFFGLPDSEGTVEIGYSVLPHFQGHGYATEMMDGLITWAFTQPNVRRIVAETTPANLTSLRVLAKLGLTPLGAGRDADSVRFARDNPANIND